MLIRTDSLTFFHDPIFVEAYRMLCMSNTANTLILHVVFVCRSPYLYLMLIFGVIGQIQHCIILGVSDLILAS